MVPCGGPSPAMINDPLSAASLVFPVPEVLMRNKDSVGCDHSERLVSWPGPAGYSPLLLYSSEHKGSEGTQGPLRVYQQICSKAPQAVYITHIQCPCQHPVPPSSAIFHPLCSWGPWQGPWAAGICSLKRYLSFHLLRANKCHKRTCPMSGAEVLHRDRCCSHGHEAANCQDCPCRRTWGPAVQEVSGRPQM